MSAWLYASLRGDDAVVGFRVDATTGALHDRTITEVADGPAPLALHPSRSTLYVGHRGKPVAGGYAGTPRPEFALSSYAIHPATGHLERTGRVPVAGEPAFVATDRSGRHLLSAHYHSGHCAVHPIDEHGAIRGPASEWLATSVGAHCLVTDPSNRFAFAPHISQGGDGLRTLPPHRRTPANAIFQFRFDEATGRLTPNEVLTTGPTGQIGPRHLRFHPSRPVAYVTNEQGSSVTVYALDEVSGTLHTRQTISTLPEGFSAKSTCSQLQVHPAGSFLYAANRGHDSIASFRVDAGTGELTTIGWSRTEPVPRVFTLDPRGRHLYAASLTTGNLLTFQVDQHTGELAAIGSTPLGSQPMWVLIAEPA